MGYKENFLRALEKAEKEVENSVTFESLENFIKENEFFVLWGASEGGKISKKIVSSYGGKVVAFVDIDSNKWNKELDGVKIYPPSQIESFVKKGAKVLISSAFFTQIGHALTDMGFDFGKDFSISTFHFEGVYKNNFVFGIKFLNYVKQHIEKFLSVIDLLEDDLSNETYIRALLHRIYTFEFTYEFLPFVSNYPQYFHPKVMPKNGSIVIDGGSWPGNFIDRIFDFGITPKKVYSIEPDRENYFFLKKKFKGNNIVSILNVALGSTQGKKFLYKTSGNFMRVVLERKDCIPKEKYYEVEVTNLDSMINDLGSFPLFIKMDIEGSELNAIKGGKRLLSEFTPSFAISLYHKPEDYWKIPLALKEIREDYRLYVGHHIEAMMDTILYGLVN